MPRTSMPSRTRTRIDYPDYGFRQYFLHKNPDTGASIALLEYDKGGTIPTKHTHASNQFMYCLEGDYEYTDSGLRLRPGSFYMNPKDHRTVRRWRTSAVC
ncbi:hypothetical protein SHIRM173S_11218 [Streptomyces hirsutus]